MKKQEYRSFASSRGWPRLINKIASYSLFAGCQAKKELINEEVVRLAAEEVGT
ncbi:MAG: hypothetical protein PWP71_1707 [Clostridia bacterium]|jgi:type II secretory pathway predicted ATPase ExeA|nr:hypothetical protein [Clostridia bacterium]